MPKPAKAPSMTTHMQAAVDHMRRTQSTALVRVGSQWWAAEQDAPRGQAAYTSATGELSFAFPTFTTATVTGLVERGVQRFRGAKRKAWWPPHSAVHFRAEFRY
jgi:hypothetical protein